MPILKNVVAFLSQLDQEQEVAYTIYTADDCEFWIDEFDTKDETKEQVWGAIVDDLHDALNEGYYPEHLSSDIAELLSQYYERKE